MRMPRAGVWATATGLLLVAFFVPVGWLVVARLLNVRLAPSNDPLGLLTAIGALMGTVFVVGGLVIALAAVITLVSLERQVDERIGQAFGRLEPAIRERADAQIEAFAWYNEALRTADWRVAELLTENALGKYDELQGARSALGLKMAQRVQHVFYYLHADTRPMSPDLDVRDDPYQPVSEALLWLDRARSHGELKEGMVLAAEATMFGVNGRYDRAMQTVHETLGQYPAMAGYLARPDRLVLLARACLVPGRLSDCLATLSKALDIDLPVAPDVVRQAIGNVDRETVNGWAGWFLLPRPEAWQGADWSRFPQLVRIFSLQENGILKAQARLYQDGVLTTIVPPPATPNAASEFLPVSDLLECLVSQHIFLCREPEYVDLDR